MTTEIKCHSCGTSRKSCHCDLAWQIFGGVPRRLLKESTDELELLRKRLAEMTRDRDIWRKRAEVRLPPRLLRWMLAQRLRRSGAGSDCPSDSTGLRSIP